MTYLDRLPSHEREKIRKRLRSPEEYERLRERVKGPEDLEREMRHNERMAELRFTLESQPETAKAMQETVAKDIREQGIENVLDAEGLPTDLREAVEAGRFQISIAPDSEGADRLTVLPEGNVQEHIPVKASFQESYLSRFLSTHGESSSR